MPRTTIDYGIDLGTTNSAIAVRNGAQVEVLRTLAGEQYIPSAVRIDRAGNIVVGQDARQRYFYDPDNTAVEFKPLMGTSTEKHFVQSNRRMTPEELSAEVLKELRRLARHRLGEEVIGAVIGVPADFNMNAEQATCRAATLAGFREVRIIQEPIAAGMAYGMQNADKEALWLVYDFGGGTFDVTVISLQEGVPQITAHAGDKHLGGKDIDWDLVDRIFTQEIVQQHRLSDFHRGNPRWRAVFAKLKLKAEEAKIALSTRESYEVYIDRLFDDAHGRPVEFQMVLSRSQLEEIAEPYILRTINLCKKLLEEQHLAAGAIEKVILVGGPTLMPYLRERLRDPNLGLGIPLEFTIDPMTAVAQGAAIVASHFPLSPPASEELPSGTVRLVLEYRPIGNDREFSVGGRVAAPRGGSFEGWTIEFTNTASRQGWRSGQIGLQENGQFFTILQAEDVEINIYRIELCDAHGNRVPCEPAEITYRIELLGLGHQILTHTIGVALATGEVAPFVSRGESIPARKTLTLKTVCSLSAGETGSVLRVPVVEGEHRKADRNRFVGSLEIFGHQVERDLPASSELEVTLEIGQDRTIQITTFVPMLRKCFETQLLLKAEEPTAEDLRRQLEKEKTRFATARSDATRLEIMPALKIARQIEEENRIPELERCLASSPTDIQALYRARDLLADLQALLDELEEVLEQARILEEANEMVAKIDHILSGKSSAALSSEERRKLTSAKELLQDAIQQREPSFLKMRIEEAWRCIWEILEKDPGFWVAVFEHLASIDPQQTLDSQGYQRWRSKGRNAIAQNDLATLKEACGEMVARLPKEKRESVPGFGSTVTR